MRSCFVGWGNARGLGLGAWTGCATNVNKTALRIFRAGEITPKTLMASTCYPTLYRAVEIDGAYYWDGGYMGNPALNPLVDCADDLLTVLIDPLDVAGEPPKNPRQIVNRINEESFNASWVWEMRQIELINQLLSNGFLQGSEYTPKRFHLIRNDRFMENDRDRFQAEPLTGFRL